MFAYSATLISRFTDFMSKDLKIYRDDIYIGLPYLSQ